MKANRRPIGVAALLVVGVIVVIAFLMRSRAVAVEDLWRGKSQLSFEDVETGRDSLTKLVAMAKDSSDEGFTRLSLMDAGSAALRLAQDVDHPPDKELNEQAREIYALLGAKFPNEPIAQAAAHCGLATVAENNFALDGDLSHKETVWAHLSAVIEDKSLFATPFMRVAIDRRSALDDIFTVVEFDPPLPKDEKVEEVAGGPSVIKVGEGAKIIPRKLSPEEIEALMLSAQGAGAKAPEKPQVDEGKDADSSQEEDKPAPNQPAKPEDKEPQE